VEVVLRNEMLRKRPMDIREIGYDEMDWTDLANGWSKSTTLWWLWKNSGF